MSLGFTEAIDYNILNNVTECNYQVVVPGGQPVVIKSAQYPNFSSERCKYTVTTYNNHRIGMECMMGMGVRMQYHFLSSYITPILWPSFQYSFRVRHFMEHAAQMMACISKRMAAAISILERFKAVHSTDHMQLIRHLTQLHLVCSLQESTTFNSSKFKKKTRENNIQNCIRYSFLSAKDAWYIFLCL